MDGLDRLIERARAGDPAAAHQLRRIFHAGRSTGHADLRLRQYIVGALGAAAVGTDPAAALNTPATALRGETGERGVAGHSTDGLLSAAVASWVEDYEATLADAVHWTAEAWSLTEGDAVHDAVHRHRPDLLA